jgi:inorganic pyrophosphatase
VDFYYIMAPSYYSLRQLGQQYTKGFRIYGEYDNKVLSLFHDIPLYVDNSLPPSEPKTLLNMVVEIPRWTNAKLEISREQPFNPIKQDEKKGQLRFVANCFPYKGYIWNYGALPQTWENPHHVTRFDNQVEAYGDNDPLDVIEIGSCVFNVGEVRQVKPLGTMALLDEGEVDWKVIAIDAEDPMAHSLNDIEDVQRCMPGLIEATRRWFEIYKVPDGKPLNQFAMKGIPFNRAYALKIIDQTHQHWKDLIHGIIDRGTISCTNRTVEGSPFRVASDDEMVRSIPRGEMLPPAEFNFKGKPTRSTTFYTVILIIGLMDRS